MDGALPVEAPAPANGAMRKPRALWAKALAVATVASPRALFNRHAGSMFSPTSTASAGQTPMAPPLSAAAATVVASTAGADLPAMSLQTLAVLTRIVAYLEENHPQEEGLYRKDGQKLETNELVALCLAQQLPDFSRYSPHSMTAALKTILADTFEPLIPYAISQQLLDDLFAPGASGGSRSEDSYEHTRRFHAVLADTFARLSATTREFFKTLLLHLNHVSTSNPCRMSPKNLAVAVGVLLIRPTEATQMLHTRDMSRKRQRVAEFLIENAPTLPFGPAVEPDADKIPDASNEALLAQSASIRLEDVDSNPSSPTAYHANAETSEEPKDTAAALLSPLLSDDEDIILETTTAALSSSSKQPTDAPSKLDDHTCTSAATIAAPVKASDEFLNFLEIQARTQVRILEVEVRAGQELIRLHKSQFERERVEMEQEMASLQLARVQVERACAELRADLRTCRTELACNLAHASAINREKSELEERLALVETERQAKDIAWIKAQAELDDMRQVAAQAQMRVEEYRVAVKGSINEGCGDAAASSKDHTVQEIGMGGFHQPAPLETIYVTTSSTLPPPSNVAALEAMKREIASDIRQQIEATTSALREMESCSDAADDAPTVAEEEAILRRLQLQLAHANADTDEAMRESRRQLEHLMNPSPPPPPA
ncbi:hypothetical protein PybrP1_006890, partial [[Pythium] brassicae (nom. inval.)]